MAPYEAPSGNVAVLLDYVRKDKREDVSHYNKEVKKSRGTDGKVFTKDGRDYCDSSIGDGKSHLMVRSKGSGIGERRYYCLNANQAIDPTGDFPDKRISGENKISKVVCPGADRAFWDDDLNLVCEYYKDNLTSQTVRDLYVSKGDSIVTRAVHDKVRTSFCSNPNNLTEKIDDQSGTCALYDNDQKLLEEFCSDGNRIKDHHICQVTTSGIDGKASPELYDKIASKYCDENPDDSWCSCYNVVNEVCDSDLSAAGCEDHNNDSNGVRASVGESAWANLKNKPQCNSSVCQTATPKDNFVYKVSQHLMNCDFDLNVCSQIVNVEAAADSPITASCDIDIEETNETTTNNTTTNNETTINNDTATNNDTTTINDTTTGADSGEDDGNRNLYIGIGLLGAIICSCCFAAIILFIMMRKN